jgi:formamidopyrimidine-DNA glycosylase
VPELPEVETVRRGLERGVAGRTVVDVVVGHPRVVRRHVAGAPDFVARLTGRTVLSVRRRGKYLWLPLDSGDALTGHLGMSGQLLVVPPDSPLQKHLHVRMRLSDSSLPGGRELRFVDQRTFGGLLVVPDGDPVPPLLAHIARDPLDPEFDDERFVDAVRRRRTGIKRALLDQTLVSGLGNIYADETLWRTGLHGARLIPVRRRRTGIKRALLDQTLVSGLGNIYADETLWRTGLHGARPTELLTRPAVRRLLAHARDVLREAVQAGGTSFDALYVSAEGVSGLFEQSLNAYGREGEPCARCGTPIRREAFMNRSSFRCPRCQPRPRAARP